MNVMPRPSTHLSGEQAPPGAFPSTPWSVPCPVPCSFVLLHCFPPPAPVEWGCAGCPPLCRRHCMLPPRAVSCPGAIAQMTACGATGVKCCLSSLSRGPVLLIWSWMGNKCSLKWQKRCHPIAWNRWETYLHWPYCFWAVPCSST